MNTVTLGVDSQEACAARFVAAMKGEAQGAYITFATTELLLQTLTQVRWHILRAVTGAGPQSVQEIACRVGRNVNSVQRDVQALLAVGVLDCQADGAIEFPYDAVHVDFMLKAE